MAKAGNRVGPYLLEARREASDTGETFSARMDDGTSVSVFLPRSPVAEASPFAPRLAQVRGLRHECLLSVLDGGEHEGARYLVTEVASGASLARILAAAASARADWPSLGTAAYVVRELARALAYIHAASGAGGARLELVHRRVTPEHVFLGSSGSVRLAPMTGWLDAETLIATAARGSTPLLAYLSPEQIDGVGIEAKSDVFALGAIFFELLARRSPFLRAQDVETLEAIRSGAVPELPTEVPPELARWAIRCLARSKDDRPSAAALATALSSVMESLPSARPERVGELVRRLGDTVELDPASEARTAAETITRSEPVDVRANRGREVWHDEAASSGASLEDTALSEGAASEMRRLSLGSDAIATGIPSGQELHPSAESGPSVDDHGGPVLRLAPQGRAIERSDPFFDPRRDGPGWAGRRFEVLEKLGSGGMGEVYRVLDRELEEIVAMKLIPQESTIEMRSTERLKREVRLARKISSPYVCRIYDLIDLGDGVRGLTMGFVEGATLSEMMRTSVPVDYERFARWGADIAEGLAAAHEISIVHRDLKPENVIIRPDDRAVILDFGIALGAEELDQSVKLTQQGMIMGTPLYMSPEQLCNVPLDGRSDLFALGLILAELITGEVPMRGGSYAELVEKRVTRVVPYHINEIDPGVPRNLSEIIDELLRTVVTQRSGHAREVAARLRAFADNSRGNPLPEPPAALGVPAALAAPAAALSQPKPEPIPTPEATTPAVEAPKPLPLFEEDRRWLGPTTAALLAGTAVLVAVSAFFGRNPVRSAAAPAREPAVQVAPGLRADPRPTAELTRGEVAAAPPALEITTPEPRATSTATRAARIVDGGVPRRDPRSRELPPAEPM